jgi:hypothetical protein
MLVIYSLLLSLSLQAGKMPLVRLLAFQRANPNMEAEDEEPEGSPRLWKRRRTMRLLPKFQTRQV